MASGEDHPVIFVMNEDGSATLRSGLAVARAGFGSFKDVAPGRSLVDELLADRRIEAARERA